MHPISTAATAIEYLVDAKETAVIVAETEKEEAVAGTSLCFSTNVSRNLGL